MLRIRLIFLLAVLSLPIIAFAQCEQLMYYDPNGSDRVFVQNVPTAWYAVRMTPHFDATIDTAYIGFGVYKPVANANKVDTVEVRIIEATLPPIVQIGPAHKAIVPPSISGHVPDDYYIIEFTFGGSASEVNPARDFYLMWRINGPAGDQARILLKTPSQDTGRSRVILSNGNTVLISNYVSSQVTDPVDLVAEARACLLVPVELSSFSASYREGRAYLEWITATETNNYGFEVQRLVSRSEEGSLAVWQRLGFVPGQGTTTAQHSYEFIDPAPIPAADAEGIVRYRLKQIDFDGKYELSPVQSVRVNESLGGFALHQNFPNPVLQTNPLTTFSFSLPQDGNARLVVFDALGREAGRIDEKYYDAGAHSVQFNASQLTPGWYLAVLFGGDGSAVRRFSVE